MKRLVADRRDYRKGYTRQLAACNDLSNNNIYSKRLLLFYSVECGLKYLLMFKWNIMKVEELPEGDSRIEILHTHNIEKMLKELGQQGMVKFKAYKTNHGDTVNIVSYHQACRYGLVGDKSDYINEKMMEQDLYIVNDWIEKEIV